MPQTNRNHFTDSSIACFMTNRSATDAGVPPSAGSVASEGDPWRMRRHAQVAFSARLLTGLLLVIMLLSAVPLGSASGQQQYTEYQVKAATLRYLAHNVVFSDSAFASANSPLVIGVLGTNPFGKTLENLCAGESVDGHPIEIQNLRRGSSIASCHIVFICSSEASRVSRVIAAAAGRPILLVGEIDSFAAAGGHLNYQFVNGAMRVEYNTAAAAQSSLKIPSKIQRAGVSVRSR